MIIWALLVFLCVHIVLLLSDPYMTVHFLKSPYVTKLDQKIIQYSQVYKPVVLRGRLFNMLGYYKSGVLILRHRYLGAQPIRRKTVDEILHEIYRRRFNPDRPYLISGDQFSVLYPRNLGVFYNQLMCREIAKDEADWIARQKIYLQSVLVAVDAYASADTITTTIVPLAPRTFTLTQVHPGSVASDTVYGILFALDKLHQQAMTKNAAQRLVREKKLYLQRIVQLYLDAVVDPETGMVSRDVHLASARDGVIRSSSFYDNVVLWSVLSIAQRYGLVAKKGAELSQLHKKIDEAFWSDGKGHYANDVVDDAFSADWLIAYVTGFCDVSRVGDRNRAARIIEYIERAGVAQPLPIKYQRDSQTKAPLFVRLFVSNYGSNAIWSYWGCEYITLLTRMYKVTSDKKYQTLAKEHLKMYEEKIIQYGGFPETFDARGRMLKNVVYKSILHTGWAVQYDYAVHSASEL